MFDLAYAMGPGPGGGGGASAGSAGSGMILLWILIFAIFYFLLIRPQQKKAKETRNMIAALKKGDRIITTGGLYGKIAGMDETTVNLEIADRVRIKVARSHVAGVVQAADRPAEEEAKEDEKKN